MTGERATTRLCGAAATLAPLLARAREDRAIAARKLLFFHGR